MQLIEVPNKAKDWDRSLTPHVSGSWWALLTAESVRCLGKSQLVETGKRVVGRLRTSGEGETRQLHSRTRSKIV